MNFGLCHMHLTEQSINLEDAALPGASETACSALTRARSAAHARVSQADERRAEMKNSFQSDPPCPLSEGTMKPKPCVG